MRKIYGMCSLLIVSAVFSQVKLDFHLESFAKFTKDEIQKNLANDNTQISIWKSTTQGGYKSRYALTEAVKVTIPGEFKSKGWNAGIMGQHYNYTVSKESVDGVYCLLTPLIGLETIDTNSVTYSGTYKLNTEYSFEKHAYYDTRLDASISANLGTNLGYSSSMFNVDGSFETKVSCSGTTCYRINNVYRKKENNVREQSFILDKRVLPYGEKNCNIAIGLVGKYDIYN
jgi:hypothetical protein